MIPTLSPYRVLFQRLHALPESKAAVTFDPVIGENTILAFSGEDALARAKDQFPGYTNKLAVCTIAAFKKP